MARAESRANNTIYISKYFYKLDRIVCWFISQNSSNHQPKRGSFHQSISKMVIIIQSIIQDTAASQILFFDNQIHKWRSFADIISKKRLIEQTKSLDVNGPTSGQVEVADTNRGHLGSMGSYMEVSKQINYIYKSFEHMDTFQQDTCFLVQFNWMNSTRFSFRISRNKIAPEAPIST